ncbi:T9SS type A sorting domain-containing protein [Flavobacterium solisilvae]|uniref:DUF4832 domain-containing protein n=1 Tax=Flavobacterium solisilvae TaxID=1852019 RepID=A0ABX1QQB1_9FLAO|nr:DUF4832 domain-containing protein [Flavobacterium solisilvae]NMH24437.1 DUF4832 domain-containing protein [Flavobacterium solisilvae]
MRRVFTTLVLFFALLANSQNTTVNYTVSTENFPNPERGFYHHKETRASNYSLLTQSSLANYRTNEKITLILRLYYLDQFLTSPISQTFLDNITTDMTRTRNAGIKCILRFAYSSSTTLGQRDASKAQILSHIQQLTPIFNANSDIITAVQAGFIGTYGEWYYTDHFGMNPTTADYANRREVVDALLTALPSSIKIQVRTPKLKQRLFNSTVALTQSQYFNNIAGSRVGHHNDCFLSDASDVGTYTNIATEYPYLTQETKFVPMGGESCDFDPNRSTCNVGTSEMALFHWSYMNIDYYPEVIDGFEDNNCLNDIKKKLGYRYELVSGTFPNTVSSNGLLNIALTIKNTGFASVYNDRTAYIVLKNTVTNQTYSLPLASNPKLWLDTNVIPINEQLTLPNDIVPGNYQMYLHLPDKSATISARPEYAIRLANENTWEATTGYNKLNHTLNVTQALSVADNTRINPVIYPVPANDELIVEMENISDFKVTLYNTLGQNFNISSNEIAGNKLSLNTQSLSDGVYLLRFENGNIVDTKRIIVKH